MTQDATGPTAPQIECRALWQLRKLYQFSQPQGIKIRKHVVHQRANISVNRHNGSICSCFAVLHTLQEKCLQKRTKNTNTVASFQMENYLHPLKLKTVCKQCLGLAHILMNTHWSTLRRQRQFGEYLWVSRGSANNVSHFLFEGRAENS